MSDAPIPDDGQPATDMTLSLQRPDVNGGQPYNSTTSTIMRSAQAQGYNTVGMSQDQSRIRIAQDVAGPPGKDGTQPTQTQDYHVQDLAQAMGNKVLSITPPGALTDPDLVDNYASGIMHPMASDSERRNFLTGHLKTAGYDDPHIVGTGDNWYHYEPGESKWYQVAKPPSMGDSSGWLNAAMQTPAILGAGAIAAPTSVAGIGIGGLLGGVPGAIAGGMGGGAAGAATGSLMGDAVAKGAMSLFDPDYRNALSGSEEIQQAGENASTQGQIGAFTGPAGTVIPRAAEALGNIGAGGARVTSWAGKKLQGPATSEFLADSIPGIGTVKQVADLPRMAESGISAIPRAATWLADSGIGRTFLSDAQREAIGDWAGGLQRLGPGTEEMGKAIANNSIAKGLQAEENAAVAAGNASRIPTNVGQRNAFSSLDDLGTDGIMSPDQVDGFKNIFSNVIKPETGAYEGIADELGESAPESGWQQMGRGVAQGAQLGRDISQPISAAVRGTGRVIQGGGDLGQFVGETTLPAAGMIAQSYGLPQAGAKVRDYLIKRIMEDRDKHSMLPSR